MQVTTSLRYHLISFRMTAIKKMREQVLRRLWSKGRPCAWLVGMQIGLITVENGTGFPQNSKNRTIILSSNLLLDLYLNFMKSLFQKDICTPMFIAALF